jgi:hypothetical protein
MEAMIEFEWLRPRSPDDGYSVVPIECEPGGALSTERKRYFEVYRPSEFPALYQMFADKPATAEGMRDFFNTFGPLEWGRDRYPLSKLKPGWIHNAILASLPLTHHAALRYAVDLFEAGDLSALSHGFSIGGWGRLRTELRPQPASKLAIVWVPSSLIQFLWLQLALYAVGDAQLFRCEQCGHPFLVGSRTGRRSKAKYCSNTCRLAAFRERQRVGPDAGALKSHETTSGHF